MDYSKTGKNGRHFVQKPFKNWKNVWFCNAIPHSKSGHGGISDPHCTYRLTVFEKTLIYSQFSRCNRMIGVDEQDLCVPSLFSVCLGIRFILRNTSIWNSPFNQSCVPNKRLMRDRVKHWTNMELLSVQCVILINCP